MDAGHPAACADLRRRSRPRGRRRCSRRSCRRRRTGSGRRSRSARRSPRGEIDSSGTPPSEARAAASGGSAASGRGARSSCRSPDRPATPIVSPWRIVIETPSRAGLGCAVGGPVVDLEVLGHEAAGRPRRGRARGDRPAGTSGRPARRASRAGRPPCRLLSWASSMNRWTSFSGAITFRNSTENVRMSP